jgi:hypothetical protein
MHQKPDTTYLKHGDLTIIAKKFNVTSSAVSAIATGHFKSKRLFRAIEALNAVRKEQEEKELQELCDSIKTESLTDVNPSSC